MATGPRSHVPRGAYRIFPQQEGPLPAVSASEMSAPRSPIPRPRRASTLRARLVGVLVLAVLLPLIATTIGGIVIARASLLSQGQQALRHRALASASTIDNYLAALQSSLESSSEQVGKLYGADLSLSTSTTSAIQTVLNTDRLANEFAASDATELVGTSGVVLVSDQSGEVGEDLHSSPSVRAALGGAGYALSPVTFDPDGPSDLLETITAAVPVRSANGGHIIGVLNAHVSMGRFAALVQSDATAAGGGVLVERNTGLILAQSLQPSAKLLFATVLPDMTSNIATVNGVSRLADSIDSRTAADHPIPGLGAHQLASLTSSSAFSGGTIDGSDTSTMLYVSVPIRNAPAATPWVYLLGASQPALTAPADQLLTFDGTTSASLAQVAVVVGVLALLAAVATGLWMARWVARWLARSIRGLGETARAFLTLSSDQRQTAEGQRQHLTGARSRLRELHQTAGELAEWIERALPAAEHAQQLRTQSNGQQGGAAAHLPGIGGWGQWSVGMRERLIRQHTICTSLVQDTRSTGEAASRTRERGQSINAQALALESSLRAAGSIAVRTDTEPPTREGKTSSGLGTRTLRIGVVCILLALGALPSLLLATTTTTLLRGNLSQQSTSALMSQAQSSERALDQLLTQQIQEVAGLESLYRSLGDPTSGMTPQLADVGLAGSVASATTPLGTTLLELVDTSTSKVVASSSSDTLLQSAAGLAVYQTVADGRAQSATSPVYYAPGQPAWYYIAVPLRSTDLTHVIGVAVGRFSMLPLQNILTSSDTFQDSSSTYALVVEQADGIIIADSRASQSVFTPTGPLSPVNLQQLWHDGRLPSGVTPRQTPLPEVASQARASSTSSTPQGMGFIGASGSGSASQNSYWLVPLSDAPWALVLAQPVQAASFIANRLTGYDLLLAAIVTLLTTMLAVVLGQSIIVPVQRMRARYREAARRLVAATRRQEEAAQRQETVLPPIESTAQLLTLETEEVGSLLFSAPPPHDSVATRPPVGWSGPEGARQAAASGAPSMSQYAAPVDAVQQYPREQEPSLDALRRARVLANDWGLRQQRVLADLATALNATDQLSRASLEGEQEAKALSRLAVELLQSAG
jgi:hypothetical protein